MGRTKKLINGEITSEKILGKLPKSSQIKSNIGNLDFDEDTVDGISILSFKTFDELKEYYPIEKIEPVQEQPKKPEAKKRKPNREKADKNKSRPPRKKAVIKPPPAGSTNLRQFDKSESEPEDEQKNLLIKAEESPPPSPLPDIPHLRVPGTSTPGTDTSTPTIKSEGCSTSSSSILSSTLQLSTSAATIPTLPPTPLPTTCGSGSPVYQPASQQHLPIPLNRVPPAQASLASRLPTPPGHQGFYAGLGHRPHPVAGSHPGLQFPLAAHEGPGQINHAELDMKLNPAKYDPRSYLLSSKLHGRFPSPAELARLRIHSSEYEKYLATLQQARAMGGAPGGGRPLFPPPPHGPHPRPMGPATPAPPSHPLLANRGGEHPAAPGASAAALGSVNSAGTAIQRRLSDKKWNSIHVYIAKFIYNKQQEGKDPLNGASANGTSSRADVPRTFLGNTKREVPREYSHFAAGLHNLPPTPASPFPHSNNHFTSSLHPPHPGLGIRGIPSLHGMHGSRFPPPSIRPPYSGLAAAGIYGLPGFDPIRHTLANYGDNLSLLDQERLQQHMANLRSSEMLNRTMYENSLRHQAAQHREQEMQREMLLHLEEQRRKLLSSADPQKLHPSSSLPSNISDIYMRPQHLQSHLKYPGGAGGGPPLPASFPNIFNRQIDPRNERFSHLIPPPKAPE